MKTILEVSSFSEGVIYVYANKDLADVSFVYIGVVSGSIAISCDCYYAAYYTYMYPNLHNVGFLGGGKGRNPNPNEYSILSFVQNLWFWMHVWFGSLMD